MRKHCLQFICDAISAHRKSECFKAARRILTHVLMVLASTALMSAQDFLNSTGTPSFMMPYPTEMGLIDAASGDLHLEFPFGSYPQRGGSTKTLKLVYDSHIWQEESDGTSRVWEINPTPGQNFSGGWRLTVPYWLTVSSPQTPNCTFDQQFWSPNGTQHWFHVNLGSGTWGSGCSTTTTNSYASDSSGLQLQTTCTGACDSPTMLLYAPDGTLLYTINSNLSNAPEDSNGNYVTSSPGPAGTDTLGRVPVSVLTTSNCEFQSSVVPSDGVNPFYKCYEVLTAQGSVQYTITWADIHVKSDFQSAFIADCTTQLWCNTTVISSIALPDGSSYSFKYDCDSTTGNTACGSAGGQSGYYGTLTSMTLPTGDTFSYTYTNYSGVELSHWLTGKSSTAGAWSFTPTLTNSIGNYSTGYPCAPGVSVLACQQVVVVKPDNSKDIATFAIDNGAWGTTVQHYDTDQATLLSTVTRTWDFSNLCTLVGCGGQGAQDIRNIITYTTQPTPGGGNITKKNAYTYDSPQTANVTEVQEWKFQNGTSSTASFPARADRTTYVSYATIGGTNNDIDRPQSVTICSNVGTSASCPGGGSLVAQTNITYDAYGQIPEKGGCPPLLTAANGIVHHDDTNFGCTYLARGNPTQVTRYVSSGSSGVTTSLRYDTTGQMVASIDSAGNLTAYSYSPDNFYSDNGSDPPSTFSPSAPTNAYVVKVNDNVGSTSLGYYYGTGQMAVSTDYNGLATYAHYLDPFSRSTKTDYPIGWGLHVYTSETQLDAYSPVGDTTASSSCVSCMHTQALLDSLGRITTGNLVNNPPRPTNVGTTYDGLNRVVAATHPNFGSTDPNDVTEVQKYDGLGRMLEVTHPDGQSSRTVYGAFVTNLGGLAAQQSSPATYGYGYPVFSVDEAGKQKQEWIDGFGHVIEVDEPGAATATGGTAALTVSGTEGSHEICGGRPPTCHGPFPDTGSLTVTINGFQATASWGSGATADTVATSLANTLNSPESPVTASINGTIITVKAGFTPSFSVTSNGPYFDFSASPTSGTLTGGSGGIAASSLVTTYTYDVLGNLTSVLQGAQTRSWQYDGLSRLVAQVSPEGGTVSISYTTSSGGLCSGSPSNACLRTDARGIKTTYTYDTANRLKQVAHSDSTGTISYTYGTSSTSFNIGRVQSITDSSGSETYTYDKMGRITSLAKVIAGKTYTTGYGYNTGGQLTQLTYPSGRKVFYNYDNVGHLCGVDVSASASCTASSTPFLTIASANYDASGRPLTANYGNGVVATATYSPQRFELTSLSYMKGVTTLFGLNYYYQQDSTNCPNGSAIGNDGQIQCIADVSAGSTGASGRSIAYTYDPLGRLLTAKTNGSTQFPAWGLSETYDRYGNRTAQGVTAGSAFSVSVTVNSANNQLTGGYIYDASGNLTGYPSSAAALTYNGEECNTGFTGSGSTATYTCDGNHLRVEKVVTGTDAVTTVYVYSGGHVIAEYDNGAAVTSPTREYIFGHNQLATITGGVSGSGGTIQYMHRDHLSPRLFTDASGNDVAEQGAFPFGEQWYKNNSTTQWVYTSYERDRESGLDYALARSYNSSLGRFTSPDPILGNIYNPQRLNRYTYVLNDVVNSSDPSGGDDDDDDDDDDSGNNPPPGSGTGAPPPDGGGPSTGPVGFDVNDPGLGIDLTDASGSFGAGGQAYYLWSPIYGATLYPLPILAPQDDASAVGAGAWGGPNDPGGETNEMTKALFGPQMSPYWGGVQNFIISSGAGMYIGGVVGYPVGQAAGAFVGGFIEGLTGRVAAPYITTLGIAGTQDAFHYTFAGATSSIMGNGLRPGTFATTTGELSPLQAQLDLALPPNRGLPNAVLRIDVSGLQSAGYEVPSISQVGRSFNMPGGGFEMQFPYAIPPKYISVYQPF